MRNEYDIHYEVLVKYRKVQYRILLLYGTQFMNFAIVTYQLKYQDFLSECMSLHYLGKIVIFRTLK